MTYRQKKKQEQEYKELFPFTLALSACNKGLGLAHKVFDRSNAMLALNLTFKFSAKNITHMSSSAFFNPPETSVVLAPSQLTELILDYVEYMVKGYNIVRDGIGNYAIRKSKLEPNLKKQKEKRALITRALSQTFLA